VLKPGAKIASLHNTLEFIKRECQNNDGGKVRGKWFNLFPWRILLQNDPFKIEFIGNFPLIGDS
jgi:hypothetical protein